jgi:hypothetical protein
MLAIVFGMTTMSAAHAHGGEAIAIGLMQLVAVGFCLALLTVLPKAASRNAFAVAGLAVGVALYWVLFPVLSAAELSEVLFNALIFAFPVGMPVIAYVIALLIIYRRSRRGA